MADYQCIKCGKLITGQSGTPSNSKFWNGTCPSTPTGNHIWQKVGRFLKVFIPFWPIGQIVVFDAEKSLHTLKALIQIASLIPLKDGLTVI